MADTKTIRPSARGLGLVVLLGFVHALWSLFQWSQLVAARTGGTSFCGLGEDSTSCTQIWDSPFASAVQEWTGVPVAGWGLVWSLAAFALPLWALVDRASSRAEERSEPGGAAWAATIWMALAGIGAIVLLITASLLQGGLCTTCVVTYTLVAAYAASCFVQTPPLSVPLARGISHAAAAVAISFMLLFIPGLRTPMNESAEGRKALLKATAAPPLERGSQGTEARETPDTTDDDVASVTRLLEELQPRLRQTLSDELLRYRQARHVPMRTPRSLIGPPDAAVRLTEFTDVLCGHCASLHETVAQLRTSLPATAFSFEPRHFPLDSSCNPELQGKSTAPVRCLAALAEICLEGHPEAFDYAGSLYENQDDLDEDRVYALAESFRSRERLSDCVNDPATQAKLEQDIAWAAAHKIEGTPLVLINGGPVAPFGPLLYALILTRGDAEHPVFDGLPEGVIRDPHEGHRH